MTAHEAAQPLQVAERRRPHAEAVRVGRLAVADDEVSELAFRRLDRVVGLAGRRIEQTRHFADDRSFPNPFPRLTDDPHALAAFFHPNQTSTAPMAVAAA